MMPSSRSGIGMLLAGAAGLALLLAGPMLWGEEEVALVVAVNKANACTDLSSADLKAYFMMEKRFWPGKDRTEVVVFLSKTGTTERRIVLDRIYGMTEDQIEAYWMELIYQGGITSAPAVKRSAALLVKEVSREPGGIAVVPADAVTNQVRVLTIDGRKPGDKDYLLMGPRGDAP